MTCGSCTEGGHFLNNFRCLQCDASCSSCNGTTSTSCLSCQVGSYLYVVNSTCGACTETGFAKVEANQTCIGIVAINQSTVIYLEANQTSSKTNKNNNIELVYRIAVQNTTLLPSEAAELARLIAFNASVLAHADMTLDSSVTPSAVLVPFAGNAFTLTVTLGAFPRDPHFVLLLASPSAANQSLQTTTRNLVLLGFSFAFPQRFDYDATLLQLASSTATTLGPMLTGNFAQNPQAAEAISLAFALDPTGIFTRFAQLIKIVNKVCYMNVKYGIVLGTFLNVSEKFSGTVKEDVAQLVANSKKYTGKLFVFRLSVEFLRSALGWKVFLYAAFCVVKWTFWGLIQRRVRIPLWTMHLLLYWDKIHMVLFNMTFVDLLFQASVTMVSHRSAVEYAAAFVGLQLVLVDFMGLISIAVSDSNWREKYIRRKEVEDRIERSLSTKESKIPIKHIIFAKEPKEPKHEPIGPKTLNYEKSYREIEHRNLMMKFFIETLRMDKRVYASIGCRLTYVFHFLRMSGYQFFISTTQFAPSVGFASLLLLETSKLMVTSVYYFRYKHIRSSIQFAMEVSQSLFLSIFLAVFSTFTLFESGGADKDEPSFLMQQVGFWTILISCSIEYLLIMIYAIMTTFYIIRKWWINRKYNIKVQETAQFPIFDYPSATSELKTLISNEKVSPSPQGKILQAGHTLRIFRFSMKKNEVGTTGLKQSSTASFPKPFLQKVSSPETNSNRLNGSEPSTFKKVKQLLEVRIKFDMRGKTPKDFSTPKYQKFQRVPKLFHNESALHKIREML